MPEEKQKMLMDNLSVILMVDNVISVPPTEEDVVTAIIEFKVCSHSAPAAIIVHDVHGQKFHQWQAVA